MDYDNALQGLKEKLGNLNRGQWIGIGIGAVLLLVVLGSGGETKEAASPSAGYTCDNIISDLKDMSKDKGPEIFEVNDIVTWEQWTDYGGRMSCKGSAETSSGSQYIEYGITTSPQGSVMVNLNYPHGVM